jgi:hypothetical protein
MACCSVIGRGKGRTSLKMRAARPAAALSTKARKKPLEFRVRGAEGLAGDEGSDPTEVEGRGGRGGEAVLMPPAVGGVSRRLG